MLEDLLPFIFMLLGMVAIGITLAVVCIRSALDRNAGLPSGYGYKRYEDERDSARDAGASAGRGSGFQG